MTANNAYKFDKNQSTLKKTLAGLCIIIVVEIIFVKN